MSTQYSWTKHIDFMIIDTIVLFLAFWFSFWVVFQTPLFWLRTNWVRYLVFVLVLNVVVTFITHPYSGILRRPYYMEVVRAFQLMVTNALIGTFMLYLLKVGALYSRGTSFYMYGLFFAFSALFNTLWKKLLLSGKIVVKTTARVPLFVIGDAQTIREVVHNVTAGDLMPYVVQGIHLVDQNPYGTPRATRSLDDLPMVERDPLETNATSLNGVPLFGEDYCRYILDNNIQEVLVAVSPTRVEPGVLERLHANAINCNLVVESTLGFQPEDQFFSHIGVYKAVGIGSFSFQPAQLVYLGIKRIIDILCGLVGLVILIPVTIIVKIAYLLSGDTAKIMYRQERVGKNGKPLRIFKFRSMVPNAAEMLRDLLKDENYRKEWDESQKFEDDPRVTKVGKVLRKTSVDELPQLINVLVGDMSLVGPRPLVKGELEKFGGLKLYQRVKPGITGWWACNGRSDIDYRERLELEYYYVKHCSIYLDLLCVMRTMLAVIKRDGAR